MTRGHRKCYPSILTVQEQVVLQKSTQWFVDRLIEKIFPAVGSFFAASLQRMLVLGHAEQHDQLEEQARLYEEQGKPHLAAMIRDQAKDLSIADPLAASDAIVGRISQSATNNEFQLAISDESQKPKRRKSKTTTRTEKQDISK